MTRAFVSESKVVIELFFSSCDEQLRLIYRMHVKVDKDQAAKFYHDLLGHARQAIYERLGRSGPAMMISLTREDEELIEFHVDDFEKTASDLEKAGVKV